MLAGLRAGHSQALVLRGEAGVGKTVLLDYLQERASGCRVERAAGVESEMELAFAGLHQLCAPLLASLEHLPEPQQAAIGTAFGLRGGDAPDRFLVGLALLGLLSEVARAQPLVCLVDDAQWLDRASTPALAFTARRLLAESVALVFVVREPSDEHELAGLPEIVVRGLRDGDARALLDAVTPGRLDERVRDRIIAETRGNPLALLELPRGLTAVELAGGFGRPDARPLASRIEQTFMRRLDPLPAATRTLLLAAAAEPFPCCGVRPTSWRSEAEAARSASVPAPASQRPHAADLLLDGLACRFTDGYGAAVPLALTYRSGTHLHAGEFAATSALIEEAAGLTRSIGGAPLMYTQILLAARRGDRTELSRLLAFGIDNATDRGEGRALTWGEYAEALLHNGLGEYEAALDVARTACERDDLGLVAWVLVELVEVDARSDRPDIAAGALDRLAERTRASGTDWALGTEARSRALLSGGETADALYQEAVERLARTRVTVHLARAHLVYGEWLRREQRRSDAREHLRAAHDLFDRFGAEGFAERARRELLATGETVRKRTIEAQEVLTPQETQVVRLAADGSTNSEIGAQLFISPRTAEHHLRKVFTKLDISSRRQLRGALRQLEGATV